MNLVGRYLPNPLLGFSVVACSLLVVCACALLSISAHRLALFTLACLLVPPFLFGAVVGPRLSGADRDSPWLSRRVLSWMLVLAGFQMQSVSATCWAQEYEDFFGDAARWRGVFGAWLIGFRHVWHFAGAKILALAPLMLWDSAWVLLAAGVGWLSPSGAPRGGRPLSVQCLRWCCVIALSATLLAGTCFVAVLSVVSDWSGESIRPMVGNDELTRTFHAHHDSCERLRSMILEDASVAVLGTTTIGPWTRHPHGWQAASRRTADLGEVLLDVGLSVDRHREYSQLLDVVGAYEIALVDDRHDRHGPHCTIRLTYQQLFMRSIERSFVFVPSGVTPEGKEPRPDSQSYDLFTALDAGWFLRDHYD